MSIRGDEKLSRVRAGYVQPRRRWDDVLGVSEGLVQRYGGRDKLLSLVRTPLVISRAARGLITIPIGSCSGFYAVSIRFSLYTQHQPSAHGLTDTRIGQRWPTSVQALPDKRLLFSCGGD